jgi:hypothetical protein
MFSGTRRRIANLWLYFALGQVLPVSFTMNLFFVAILVTQFKFQPSGSSRWRAPRPEHQVLFLSIYFATLFIAPSTISTKALMPVVLLARSLLFYPYLALRPEEITSNSSTRGGNQISENETEHDGFLLRYKATAVTTALGYISLQLLHVMQGSFIALPQSANLISAITDNYAVSTLGYDFLIAIASLGLWVSTWPNSNLRGKGVKQAQ